MSARDPLKPTQDADLVRPRWEYDLRLSGGGRRTLMERIPGGIWQDVAVFDDYNDADRILRLILKGLHNDGPGPISEDGAP